tara:strand:+ start:17163 stop:17642 length:480 start_codon:yes stop_codon:yes gene_type:complete
LETYDDDDVAGFLIAISTSWAVVSSICLSLSGIQIVGYAWVTFYCHGSETKTCPSSVVVEEMPSAREDAVRVEVVVIEIEIGQSMVIFERDGVAGFVIDLKRVSAERDEVVEKQGDCPMESGGGREIDHGDLLDRDRDPGHRQGHRCLARDEVVVISSS